jgi:2-hydroxychromene-2-carboxylate isomerase
MSASAPIDPRQPYFFFDFVSPFSYLLFEQREKWPNIPFETVAIDVLNLFKHWGQPHYSAIPSKRVFTYRHALFRAEQLGIPFKMPASHPFDSSKPLRLAIAAGGDLACIREIFRYIWRFGNNPSTEEGFEELCRRVGLSEGAKMIELEDVKARLAANQQLAVDLGVFGVPTFIVNQQLFWGEDTLPMVLYVARSPNWLDGAEVNRISNLPTRPPHA